MNIRWEAGSDRENAIDDPSPKDGVDGTFGVEKALSGADRKSIESTAGEGVSVFISATEYDLFKS